ncbi:Uncharacterised protein [uncultured Roseburia sp.]|uniref:Uncharacterized protein n=1 Tax=Brotonthovivens ammoniilytica TaxID=2981725 RepID=A0ABT2TJW6_9FIRM|nr:hypothetical protein [Brotonthovivens ammoniilytica]MCU6761819.1 hypothetical protein [Brotonthovivens ammoniilytica]SCI47647.1 Uncharacterised protein [uncultured Roseburia sp.]
MMGDRLVFSDRDQKIRKVEVPEKYKSLNNTQIRKVYTDFRQEFIKMLELMVNDPNMETKDLSRFLKENQDNLSLVHFL